MKLFYVSLVAMMLFLFGCGGGGSDIFEGFVERDGVKYKCISEKAFNDCKSGECSACEEVENLVGDISMLLDCAIENNVTADGNTTIVYADFNSSCKYDGAKVECLEDGGIKYQKDGSNIESGSGEIDIFENLLFKCKDPDVE
jgi:hypothetical protein